MANRLTVKQELFCQTYLRCGNASEAYRVAYSCEKMKPETIKRKAAGLMSDGNIRATIDNSRTRAEKRAELKIDKVIELLSGAIMADVTEYVKPDGSVRASDILRMPVEKRRLIESIQTTKDGVKLSLMSKASAIERLGKMLGWEAATRSDSNITINFDAISPGHREALAALGRASLPQ